MAKKYFIWNIVALSIGLVFLAGLISFGSNFNFGATLFFVGIMVGGIGAFLGGPDPTDPNNPKNLRPRSLLFRKQPIQDALDQIRYNNEHMMPRYSFENVMAFAGFIALLLSIPFLILLILSN